mgnify:CR=1 FL=1
MYKILIIEDDRSLCNHIKEGISKWNFEGIGVQNFEEIYRNLQNIIHIWLSWILIYPILMDFTGVKRLGIFPMFQSYFFPQGTAIWISLWRLIWGEMTM